MKPIAVVVVLVVGAALFWSAGRAAITALTQARPAQGVAAKPEPPPVFVRTAEAPSWRQDGWPELRADDYRARLCSLGPIPLKPTDNVPHAARLGVAIAAGDWAAARRGLALDGATPAGLTSAQAARVRRERLSLALYPAAVRGDPVEIDRLLRLGADPNVDVDLDQAGTPLSWAARCDHAEAVRVLVRGGARVDQPVTARFERGNVSGATALLFASATGAERAVEVLLGLGAEPNPRQTILYEGRSGPGLSALQAAATPAVRRRLLQAGAHDTPRQIEEMECSPLFSAGYELVPDEGRVGVRGLLERQGADFPLHKDVCLWRVGVARGEDGKRYTVYDYQFTFGEARRANNRIILLEDDRRYVGYYSLDEDVQVRGADILFPNSRAMPVLHIGPDGPPRRLGEHIRLSR